VSARNWDLGDQAAWRESTPRVGAWSMTRRLGLTGARYVKLPPRIRHCVGPMVRGRRQRRDMRGSEAFGQSHDHPFPFDVHTNDDVGQRRHQALFARRAPHHVHVIAAGGQDLPHLAQGLAFFGPDA